MVHYIVMLALTGALPLGLAMYAWQRRTEPAVGAFIVAAAAGSLWPLLILAEIAAPGLEFKSWLVRVRPPLILVAVSALLVMALRHGDWKGSTKLSLAFLAPVPAFSLLFNFLPATQGWFQHDFRLHPQIPQVLAYENGIWARFYEVYVPLLAFSVIGILLAQAKLHRGLYRRRSLMLAAGVGAPTLLYVMQLSGLTAWTNYNLPPLGMAITGLCGAWVVLRDRSLDLIPIARTAIFEQWPQPVLIVNQRGEVMDANPAADTILGAGLGSPVHTLNQPWSRELQGYDGRAPKHGELVVDGASYAYDARPLLDEQGEWQGWLLVGQNVTERVLARAELENLNASLRREIQQRRATEARLLETHRIETIGRLSGGVAHEFNNLTMVINGYAHLVLSRLGENDPNRAAVEAIAQAGEEAARLTAQLLDFSRKQVMQADLVDARMLVREARHMWITLLGERGRLRFEDHEAAQEAGAWVSADASKLREALTQLILNARDSIRGGGLVTVAVDVLPVKPGTLLRSPGMPPGEYVRISITDTGIGMDEATLARAFEPFFSTKDVGQGSGLGLSSAYGIARQFGGTLELESVPGAGTTARLYLPSRTGPAEAEPAPPADVDPGVHIPAHILIVEDQSDVRALLRALLEADGHQVQEASGAAAALRIIQDDASRLDLLVTDLVMPGLSGQELIRRLEDSAPGLPVLVISAYSGEDAPRAGAFLRKPFTSEQFSREVARLLQGRFTMDR
ncbi:MAG: response regulator [Bryobacteraceae bacterium]|nr:response regulator [Bryobacteraceae bacterium]